MRPLFFSSHFAGFDLATLGIASTGCVNSRSSENADFGKEMEQNTLCSELCVVFANCVEFEQFEGKDNEKCLRNVYV